MHRCLHIHEVLELIVTYLYNEGRCPRSLASMAVACRAFYEPATNQLWSRLRGMKPLIQCLPPDAIEIHDKDSNYPHAIDITREPSGEEWSRFRFFARRVKEIVIKDCHDDTAPYATHKDVFYIFGEHPRDPILPNLERLDFLAYDHPEAVTLFVQPSLRRVTFMPDNVSVAEDLLHRIQTEAPNVENISMSSEVMFLQAICDQFSETIRTMQNLTCLNFGPMPLLNKALIHLSSLPSLRMLALELKDDNLTAWTSPLWGGFGNLITLRVTTWVDNDMSTLASFLDSLDKTNIMCLAVWCYAAGRMTSLHRLFAAIGQFNPERLVQCSVDFTETAANGWEDGVLDFATIAPLLRLRQLMHFELRAMPIQLTTANVQELCAAWPNIRRLFFDSESDARTRRGASVDLRDLAVFAERCRMLEHLTIEARPPADGWSWTPGGPRSQPSFASCLDLCHSRFPRAMAEDVVAFLADVFPFAHTTFERPWFSSQVREEPIDEWRAVLHDICRTKNGLINNDHGKVASMLLTLTGVNIRESDYF